MLKIESFLRIPLMIIPFILAFFSCANDMAVVNGMFNAEVEPDMVGTNVETWFSDSARLQTKMVAPVFKQFDSAKEQRRECPEGLHVWFYEKTGEVKAELTANWARQDMATDLWEARSNVVMSTSDGTKMETEQLFWDPKKGIVYSEKHTKITDSNGMVATGSSFWATQDFEDRELRTVKGNIPFEDEEKN